MDHDVRTALQDALFKAIAELRSTLDYAQDGDALPIRTSYLSCGRRTGGSGGQLLSPIEMRGYKACEGGLEIPLVAVGTA